jgi:hypothetical protein
MHRDARFEKNTMIVGTYSPYLVNEDDEDVEEEVATAEWN